MLASGKKTFEKFQCVQCHVSLEEAEKVGKTAADLAPRLELAKDRLQYDWIRDWLVDPQTMKPGTRMPNFFYFQSGEKQISLFPDSDEKIESIQMYLQKFGSRNVASK